MPTEATLEIRHLVVAAIDALQLPMDAFDSTRNTASARVDRMRRLGLDKLKRVPTLQPFGSIYSSDLALRLFHSCRKDVVDKKFT